MPDESTISRVEELLLLPQRRAASEAGIATAEARQKALNLPDRAEVPELSATIAKLAGKEGVIVEWRARDLDPASSVVVSCCCCCCCCS